MDLIIRGKKRISLQYKCHDKKREKKLFYRPKVENKLLIHKKISFTDLKYKIKITTIIQI